MQSHTSVKNYQLLQNQQIPDFQKFMNFMTGVAELCSASTVAFHFYREGLGTPQVTTWKPSKTLVLHLRKSATIDYGIGGHSLRMSDETRDLVVYVSKNLEFYSHVKLIFFLKAFAVLFTIIGNVRRNRASTLVKLSQHILLLPQNIVQQPRMLKRDVSHGKSKLQRTFTRILMYRYFPKTDCTQPMSNYRDRLTMFELQSFFFVAAPSMVGVLGFNLPKVEFDQASIGAPRTRTGRHRHR